MTDTLDNMLSNADPDPANSTPIDLAPVLGQTFPPIPGAASAPPAVVDPLPTGVHPLDQSVPITEGGQYLEPDKPPSQVGPATEPVKGSKPFARANEDALPVNQRAAHDFRTGLTVVNTNNGGVATAVGRRPGRKSLTLWIPAQVVVGGAFVTPPNGVMISNNEGELQQSGGAYLAVGGSITLETESSVQVGLVPGATIGYVQYLDLFDEPGGVTGGLS